VAWNPALHPRGPDGRFTKSFARPASAKDRKRRDRTRRGLKPHVPFRTPGDAHGWLSGMSTQKGRELGQMDRMLAQLRAANQQLRAGKDDQSGFESLLAPTPEDVTAYRSVPADGFGNATPQDLQGMVVSDAGYFPTSLAPQPAAPGLVRMEIGVPAGTQAAAAPDTSELVLDRELEMSVDEVSTGPDGQPIMRLTVLGSANGDEPEGGEGPGSEPAGDQPGPDADPAPDAAGGHVGDVIDGMPAQLQNDAEGRAWRQRAIDQLGGAMNGSFAGLNAEVVGASPLMGGPDGADPGVSVRIRLTDADGNEVGHAERGIYRDADGNLAAVHELLELDPEVRGQGFASAFNQHLTDWYRQQGVERIELTANIDVGGYAWASHGYDFADEESAQRIANRLMERLDGAPPEVQRGARELLSRFDRPFGSDGFPTPFEISRLGRDPGATSWLGKDVLLNSAWEGVKWLDRPTPASRS